MDNNRRLIPTGKVSSHYNWLEIAVRVGCENAHALLLESGLDWSRAGRWGRSEGTTVWWGVIQIEEIHTLEWPSLEA